MSLIHSGLRWFKIRFPRLAWRLRNLRPSRIQEQKQWEGKSTEEVFTTIYEKNAWQSAESRSGFGSTLRATEAIRAQLPRVVQELGARSFLDAPCGDFHWMQHCPLPVDLYIGADIVPALIADLNARYARTNQSPERRFCKADITTDPLPDADIFFCRDCFLHLSFDQVHAVLENFRKSKCRFLITSTYRDVRANLDHFTGGVRPLNLVLAPFNLPEPTQYLEDPGETQFHRCMGVWTKEQVASARRR